MSLWAAVNSIVFCRVMIAYLLGRYHELITAVGHSVPDRLVVYERPNAPELKETQRQRGTDCDNEFGPRLANTMCSLVKGRNCIGNLRTLFVLPYSMHYPRHR